MSAEFILESKPGVRVVINGKNMLYFAGTSYFQFHSHPSMLQAVIDATLKYGVGSASSRTISGTSDILLNLEKKLASFFGTDDAVYLPSGYLVNMAGLEALKKLNLFDVVFVDEQSHYSIIDAVSVVGKETYFFEHCNAEHLRNLLQQKLVDDKRPLIVSDGVFPVSADFAPLPDFVQLAEEFDGIIWIDDAHCTGILGEHRRGISDYYGIISDKVYQGTTLAKAFGAYGGAIAGREEFIQVIKSGSILTGSSAPMAAAIAASNMGIELLKENTGLLENLQANTKMLKQGLRDLNLTINMNEFPVAAFSLESADHMRLVQKELMDENIFIQFMNYKGAGSDGVLRIVVSALHKKEDIDFLLETLKYALK